MKRTLLVALLVCLVSLVPRLATAADPAFVGALALATDADVAKDLGLSEDVRKQLDDLIAKREDEILQSGLDQLPDDEQQKKLAEFVVESEKQGLALLNKEQQEKLMQIRIARGGLSTLTDSTVAEAVGLSAEQHSNVEKLMAGLKTKMAAGTEAERRVAKAEAERELSKLLSNEQRVAWQKLAGLAAGDEQPVAEDPEDAAEVPDAEEVKPAERPVPKTRPGSIRPGNTRPDATRPTTTKPDDKPELGKPRPERNLEDVVLTFNFSYAPFKDVLEWLAKEADLSLVADPMPPGTFNYKDNRKYTVPQAIDVINSILLRRGYTLVRHERMLFVFNVEDGLPLNFAPTVKAEELDKRGEYEIVGVLFTFDNANPEDVEADVRKIVGPGSSVVVLAKSKQMYVQETAGKLRTIRSIIENLEGSKGLETIAAIMLKHKLPEEIMATARQLMNIPEGMNATPDGSLRIANITGGFMVKGQPEPVDAFKALVEKLDVESEGGDLPPPEKPQIVVYPITTADPDAALQVLQTVMAGQAEVRIAKDPKTGSIIAHATPTQHATIKALIDEMQQDTRSFEVIKLRKLDPELAVATLNKAFGIVEGELKPSNPRLVADATQMLLIVFGSKQQIEQVREAVMKMGEAPASGDSDAFVRSNTRSISLTGRSLEAALAQIEAVGPVYFPNEIRVVRSPAAKGSSDEIPSRIPVPKHLEKRPVKLPATTNPSSATPDTEKGDDDDDDDENRGRSDRRDFRRRFERDDRGRDDEDRSREEDRRSQKVMATKYYYVAWQDTEAAPQPLDAAAPAEAKPVAKKPVPEETPAAEQPSNPPAANPEAAPREKSAPGAEVVITVTPSGIIVTSQDLDALDRVEELLSSFVDGADQGKEYTIFYLRYARADVAAELLGQALGGGGGGDDSGGSLMGDMMGSMLGGGGGGGIGGLMGAMLGGGGGSSMVSSGPVLLIPDNRLNAILAQGKPADLDLAETLLKIIDRQESEVDVETTARPRFIPVYHTTAEDMANTIKQVYANRLAAAPGQPAQQPNPAQLLQMLGGGRGGRGGRGGGGLGGGNDRKSEEQKMAIGVDAKSNSLIVSAPPYLFEEVKAMVEELDTASSEQQEIVQVISTPSNATLMKESLSSILGESVEISILGSSTTPTSGRTTSQNTSSSRTANNRQGSNSQPQANQEQMQRFIQNMQGGGGRGGGGGGRGGGGGGGNRGGGRGGR